MSAESPELLRMFGLISAGDSARLHFLFKNMSHCLTVTPNPLLFTYLIVNLTPSVFLLAFGL